MNLTKQVVLITGGASGIGLGIAKELLENGIKGVSIVDINRKGKEVAEELNIKYGEGKVIFIHADVSNKPVLRYAFQQTVSHFGSLDVVFNNAGIVDEDNVERCYNVNLVNSTYTGAHNCMQLAMDEFLPKYKATDETTIVNTASVVALNPTVFLTAPSYAASKCGLLGLTRCLSHEFHYKRTLVRVMAICPGLTQTPILKGVENFKYAEESAKIMKQFNSQEVADLTKHIVPILVEGKNGSVWVLEDKQRKEVYFPSTC